MRLLDLMISVCFTIVLDPSSSNDSYDIGIALQMPLPCPLSRVLILSCFGIPGQRVGLRAILEAREDPW